MCRKAQGLVLRQLGSILKFTTAVPTVSLFFILCHPNKVYMQLKIFCQNIFRQQLSIFFFRLLVTLCSN